MFDANELNLLRAACMMAACESRNYGHNAQADQFHALADKCFDLVGDQVIADMDGRENDGEESERFNEAQFERHYSE